MSPGTYSFTVTGQADVDGHSQTRSASVSVEVLPVGTLAITGRVLTAEAVPKPIPGVQITFDSGSAFTRTDAAGNFVLQGPLASGPSMLRVDGTTASSPTVQYPLVEVQIDVASSGPTRVPFILYLPALDTAHPIDLHTNADGFTTQEVQATTPLIPGLVVTIPVNTKITGPDGQPVRQITITPVPIDRSPMPFPPGITPPMLFSIQPGNSVPSQPLPISFPNVTEAPPGTKADLWFFDLAIGGWQTWGTGTVSADGTQVVSDPGFGLPRFAWHTWVCAILDALKKLRKTVMGGEPVDLATGRFIIDKTDFVLSGRLPVSVQRTYRSDDTTRIGFFGRGWNIAGYDYRLTSSTGNTLVLTTPDQSTYQLRPSGSTWISNDPSLLGTVVSRLLNDPVTGAPLEFSFLMTFKDRSVHRYDRIVGFANQAGLSTMTDRNGNVVTITRESPGPTQERFGLITRITEPAGRFLTLAYDTAGRITGVTDPIGRSVLYTYDGQGHLATVTDAAGGLTSYTYDASHHLVTITDPRTITYLTNEYDAQGRVSRQTQADGGVFTFAYTLEGQNITATTITDPRGNATTHRFNSSGFPVSTTDALGQTTTFDYTNGTNLLISTTDPLGRVTRFEYDTLGNVTTVTDPTGAQRGFTYEPTFNRVTSITNPVTPPTQFGYDTVGNLRTITDPGGKPTTLTYNAAGQPLTITDPLFHTTTFTYDSVGNLATIADPLGNTTRFDYDAVSRRIRQIDPRGRATGFGYDALNRVRTITDALSGVTSFTYDGNGNLLTLTDARPNPPTTYTYDSMDRVASRTDPLGASEAFVYDLAGNLTRRTDRKGQASTFTYDALNRQTTASYADGSGTSTAYDAAGRPVRVDDASGGALTNTYDALDRLLAQSTPLGTVGYGYDAIGRRTQLTTPGDVLTTYGYDENSQLTQIQRGAQTTALNYDDAGRRRGLALPNGVSTQYEYDAASRLIALTYQTAAGSLGDLSYQYDAAGKRIRVGGSFARTLLSTAVATASYDGANRQLAFGANQVTFDANGNATTIMGGTATTSLTWDARDRLIGVEQAGTQAGFAYAFGRRLTKTVNGAATQYLYDGLDMVQQLEPQRTTSYLRSLALDETLGFTNPDGTFFLTADALGSTVAVRDGAGSAVTEYTYDPFGAATATNPVFANSFQFTGRENDGFAGLYYYRARYYHPGLQRFISEDPIGFAGGDPNLYAYVANNPINYLDPFGLDKERSKLEKERSKCGGSDYAAWTLNIGIPHTFDLLGGSFLVALDRYGRPYVGSGPTVGRAFTFISGSGVNGTLEGGTVPSSERLRNFLSGPTFSYGGGIGLGGNTVISPGNGRAKEVGVFSPQYGGSYIYSYAAPFRIAFLEATCN
ncbi:MAG TPA: RHS repeat-associated core domain-containing protein [Vicinamibacterales bacterium]|nr:RHS repeat-associated core domain-containing protein [Vicinamibacterales bacterium]